MKIFIIFIFLVITAVLAAIALALVKIGAEEIFRYAKRKRMVLVQCLLY